MYVTLQRTVTKVYNHNVNDIGLISYDLSAKIQLEYLMEC